MDILTASMVVLKFVDLMDDRTFPRLHSCRIRNLGGGRS